MSAGDLGGAIRDGSMPPWYYVLLHPNTKLSHFEKERLISGLNATLAKSPPKGTSG